MKQPINSPIGNARACACRGGSAGISGTGERACLAAEVTCAHSTASFPLNRKQNRHFDGGGVDACHFVRSPEVSHLTKGLIYAVICAFD
jgi:hypothetical protein